MEALKNVFSHSNSKHFFLASVKILSFCLKTLRYVIKFIFQGNFGIEVLILLPLALHSRKGSRKASGSKIN